eukprot:7122693-Pyramimonas_sp.AAC.1
MSATTWPSRRSSSAFHAWGASGGTYGEDTAGLQQPAWPPSQSAAHSGPTVGPRRSKDAREISIARFASTSVLQLACPILRSGCGSIQMSSSFL